MANNPDATILGGFGVNQGSGNAGLACNVDGLTISNTVCDFERVHDAEDDGIADTPAPTSKDQCKNSGYQSFNNPSFRNQGECVSYVSPGK